jgi:uncharacterized Rmd1/YagE family protein
MLPDSAACGAGAEVNVSGDPGAPSRELVLTAVALEGRLPKGDVAARLPWPVRRRDPSGACWDLPGGGRLHVFGFGALVHVGAAVLDPALLAEVEGQVGLPGLPATQEVLRVAVDPSVGERPRVEWARLVLPALGEREVDAAALVLAESAAVERYEQATAAMVDETLALADELARAGRPRAGLGPTVRRVAALARQRLELAGLFFLVDRPELAWESAGAALVHDALFDHFELRERHQAMLHRLGLMEGTLQILIGLWEGRRGRLLEGAIVALIVLEIALALARVY